VGVITWEGIEVGEAKVYEGDLQYKIPQRYEIKLIL